MKTTLTKIGNSKGIIIPMHLLKQCGFEDEISLEVKEGGLVLSKVKKPRDGWKEQFTQGKTQESSVLIDEFSNEFDKGEWTW